MVETQDERRLPAIRFTDVVGYTALTERDEAAAVRVRVPALVVAGSSDISVPREASRALAALIPGARFEIVEGAGHIQTSGSDPRLIPMVSEFLAEEIAAGER